MVSSSLLSHTVWSLFILPQTRASGSMIPFDVSTVSMQMLLTHKRTIIQSQYGVILRGIYWGTRNNKINCLWERVN